MKPLPSHNTHPPHSCCRPLLTRWQCTECLQWARLCSKYCTYNSELSEQFPHLLELWSQQRRKTIKNTQKCHTSIDKYHEEETRRQWDSDGAVGTGVALSDEGDLRGPLWAWTWGVRERARRNVWVKKGYAWRHGEKGGGGGNQMKVGAVDSALSVTEVGGFWERGAGSDVHIARTALAAGGEQTVGEQGRVASPLPWAVINSQSGRHGLHLQGTDNPLGGVLMVSLGAQAPDGRLSSSGSQGSSSLSNAEVSFL